MLFLTVSHKSPQKMASGCADSTRIYSFKVSCTKNQSKGKVMMMWMLMYFLRYDSWCMFWCMIMNYCHQRRRQLACKFIISAEGSWIETCHQRRRQLEQGSSVWCDVMCCDVMWGDVYLLYVCFLSLQLQYQFTSIPESYAPGMTSLQRMTWWSRVHPN